MTPTTSGLFLSQRKYIGDLLEKMGMLNAKCSPTPMIVSQSLTVNSGAKLEAPTGQQWVVCNTLLLHVLMLYLR